jgi:hypothetical protein
MASSYIYICVCVCVCVCVFYFLKLIHVPHIYIFYWPTPKSSPVVKQQYVDTEYMRNKLDMHFNRVLEACDLHGITDELQFRHN